DPKAALVADRAHENDSGTDSDESHHPDLIAQPTGNSESDSGGVSDIADLQTPTPKNRFGWGWLVWGGVFALLALLSKEYAVSLLVLVPLMLWTFGGATWRGTVRYVWPVVLAVAVAFGLRLWAVGFHRVESVDLLNDPYLLATPAQTWATKLYVLLKYLGLLIWPHPLAADYSYRQIAYRGFHDPMVWLAILVGLVFLAVAIVDANERD
ncbi:MAG: hypothetical protein KC729_07250, partial [Candidatus Eisenbacteria bacterium]|nr:hypothetical protein [Candidatus Eisenbacteria bacterium]